VVAVGEHLVLQRQERASGVDEVEAWQPVLSCYLLRAQMLLHGEGEIRPALDRRVVRDDHALLSLDRADAGDDPRARRLAVIDVPRRERVQLEKGRVGIEEAVDALPRRQLPPRPVALHGALATALRHLPRPRAELCYERSHPLMSA
jgi:hypothetical protein